MQSDDVEVYTFENQRWNVVTGLTKIIGLSEGFSSLGKNLDNVRIPFYDDSTIAKIKPYCRPIERHGRMNTAV